MPPSKSVVFNITVGAAESAIILRVGWQDSGGAGCLALLYSKAPLTTHNNNHVNKRLNDLLRRTIMVTLSITSAELQRRVGPIVFRRTG